MYTTMTFIRLCLWAFSSDLWASLKGKSGCLTPLKSWQNLRTAVCWWMLPGWDAGTCSKRHYTWHATWINHWVYLKSTSLEPPQPLTNSNCSTAPSRWDLVSSLKENGEHATFTEGNVFFWCSYPLLSCCFSFHLHSSTHISSPHPSSHFSFHLPSSTLLSCPHLSSPLLSPLFFPWTLITSADIKIISTFPWSPPLPLPLKDTSLRQVELVFPCVFSFLYLRLEDTSASQISLMKCCYILCY